MLFNLFGNKDEGADDHVFIDRAYMTTAAKMKACAALARQEPTQLFVCWFADTTTAFRNFFKEQGLNENVVVEAGQLQNVQIKDRQPVFVEHYPLHEKEMDFISGWNGEKIIVYSAIDEPLFKHFGSDKILPIMKMLGMKEDEVIEHNLVTKSIVNGQSKIAGQVSFDHPATSQAAWMEKNLK